MHSIFRLINLFEKTTSINDLTSKIGKIKRTFKEIYFIAPYDSSFKGVSVNTTNDKIDWIGVSLNKAISVNKIIEEYGSAYEKHYNHYDEETALTFRSKNTVCLICFVDGYIKYEDLINAKFSELRLNKNTY